jgi:hypothetical protein
LPIRKTLMSTKKRVSAAAETLFSQKNAYSSL